MHVTAPNGPHLQNATGEKPASEEFFFELASREFVWDVPGSRTRCQKQGCQKLRHGPHWRCVESRRVGRPGEPDCGRNKNGRAWAKVRAQTFHECNPERPRRYIRVTVPSHNCRVRGPRILRDSAGRRPFDPAIDFPVGKRLWAGGNHRAATVEAGSLVPSAGQGDQFAASPAAATSTLRSGLKKRLTAISSRNCKPESR